jgi:hypothetical protein
MTQALPSIWQALGAGRLVDRRAGLEAEERRATGLERAAAEHDGATEHDGPAFGSSALVSSGET